MAPNSLFPAFVQLFYHSDFGVHVQTLPTKAYDEGTDKFDVWSGSPVDAQTMLDDLVDTFLPLYPATVSYDTYRIFQMASPTAVPQLAKIGVFTAKDGSDGTPGWTQAVQGTLSALGLTGTKARIVLLDSSSGNDFSPIFTRSGQLDTIMDEWGADGKGWSTRGGDQITTFLEYSKTLNEKLRREYRMF